MNSIMILIVCAAFLVILGGWLGYSSKPNKEARLLLAEKNEKEAKQKAFVEAAGRETNRKANQKLEVLAILDEVIRNPQRLRGTHSSYPHTHFDHTDFREFIEKSIKAINRNESGTQALDELRTRVIKQSELIRDLQGQLKEISKALQLGQPVE